MKDTLAAQMSDQERRAIPRGASSEVYSDGSQLHHLTEEIQAGWGFPAPEFLIYENQPPAEL